MIHGYRVSCHEAVYQNEEIRKEIEEVAEELLLKQKPHLSGLPVSKHWQYQSPRTYRDEETDQLTEVGAFWWCLVEIEEEES